MTRDIIVADFETHQPNEKGKVGVYLWAFLCSWDDEIYLGTTIDSFVDKIVNICEEREQCVQVFFHNGAGFDYHYLIFSLSKKYKQVFFRSKDEKIEENEFKKKNTIKEKKMVLKEGEWNMLCSDRMKIMTIRLGLKNKKKRNHWKGNNKYITFKDSNLLFPSSLAGYGKAIGIEKYVDFKGFLDIYNCEKDLETFKKNVKNSEEHINYIKQDCYVLMGFLEEIDSYHSAKKWKIAAAGSSYDEFLRISTDDLVKIYEKITRKNVNKIETYKGYWKYAYEGSKKSYKTTDFSKSLMKRIFLTKWGDESTILKGFTDGELARDFYYGGITQVNPEYQGVLFRKKANVYFSYADINSSYPHQMLEGKMPYGKPVSKKKGDFHLMKITATKEMKNTEGLPFLSGTRYVPASITQPKSEIRVQWLTTIKIGESFNITSIEWERVKKYYGNDWKVKYCFSFHSMKGANIFGTYIKKWHDIKKEAREIGNEALTKAAKIRLNTLYGIFGQNPKRTSAIWETKGEENDWNWGKETTFSTMKKYLPIAISITAHGRMRLVDFVGKNYKYVAYSDTDSMIYMTDKKHLFPVSKSSELGAWKIETERITDLIVRHKKQYFFETEDKNLYNQGLKTVVAGVDTRELDLNKDNMIRGTIAENQKEGCFLNGGKFLKTTRKHIWAVWNPPYLCEERIWFHSKRKIKEKQNDYIDRLKFLYYKNHLKQLRKIQNFKELPSDI